ncbi:MAG: hypothetical protein IAE80_08450, partial [Anaerolinea sp.]|nr:hypothetical protein [Anaerolinea sp.]
MDRISAASNLLIEMQPESWRLLLNGSTQPNGATQPLLEARSGEPIRYVELFGLRRKLPLGGELALSDVERVVLGWSAKDESWHLGLVLTAPLATERQSRWCELAHWNDVNRTMYRDLAVSAGEALAGQIDRPFVLISPEKPQTPIPLPELPIKFEGWTFESSVPGQYELVRAPGWARAKLLRALWYLVWMVIFIVLAASSLTSGIALPNPALLVPAGFVSALFLLIAAITLIVRAFTRPNRIVIDRTMVRWMRGSRETNMIPVSEVQGVYASHITGSARRRNNLPKLDPKTERAVLYGELNLDLRSDKFVSLLTHGVMEETIPLGENP